MFDRDGLVRVGVARKVWCMVRVGVGGMVYFGKVVHILQSMIEIIMDYSSVNTDDNINSITMLCFVLLNIHEMLWVICSISLHE